MRVRPPLLTGLLGLAACASAAAPEPPAAAGPSALEAAIAADLSAGAGAAISVRCLAPLGVVLACDAHLPDGTALPIAMRDAGSAWEWDLGGRLMATAPVVDYVRGVVADLGAAQAVDCGAPVRRVPPGERMTCTLAGGGAAYVTIRADGALAVEVALSPAAAAARGEPVTPSRAEELEGRSRALASGAGAE